MSGLIIKVETQFIMEMTKRNPESPRIEEKLTACERGTFHAWGEDQCRNWMK